MKKSKKEKTKQNINLSDKIIKIILVLFIVYFFAGGILPFYIHSPDSSSYLETLDHTRFFSDNIGPDMAVISASSEETFAFRLNIIDNAKEYLYMSLHSIDAGITSDIMFASLIKAANRDVDVKIILDGMFHNLKFSRQNILYAMISHPNIKISYYEPINLFIPWALNNRLHDKYIIADDQIVLTGGSNIGDRYTLDSNPKDIVNDRDIVIYRKDISSKDSVVLDFKNYFFETWDSQYNVLQDFNLTKHQINSANKEKIRLFDSLEKKKDLNSDLFLDNIDWNLICTTTNKITLITNPLDRLNKTPHIFMEINNLLSLDLGDVYIQSPYIVPTGKMLKYFDPKDADIFFITNSIATNANYFGAPGYMARKNKILSFSEDIYEYHGIGSIHGKTYLFGDELSMIGSFNFDSRSTFLSTESMVVIHGEEFALKLKEDLDIILSDCIPIKSMIDEPNQDYIEVQTLSFPKYLLFVIIMILLYPLGHFM